VLKKPSLRKSLPSGYRLISNLNNIYKLLERLFLNRIQYHILSSPHFNSYQSAYRYNHSTETAILSTLDHIYHSFDLGMSTVLVSLDLSAAFDTVDHFILLNRLQTSFGLPGTVLAWFQSYLSCRTQSVRLGNYSSSPLESLKAQFLAHCSSLFTLYPPRISTQLIQSANDSMLMILSFSLPYLLSIHYPHLQSRELSFLVLPQRSCSET
jgi:Reverse transcriptase (RNA-dependent DNA polymerase)